MKPTRPVAAKPPKLVVVVVIDQLRASDLTRYGANLKGGIRRLLDTGAVIDGHYGHQNTYTAPGHAQILSGSYGYANGIVQNRWFNRATNRIEGMLFDPGSKVLGHATVEPDEETSPKNFAGSTIGDELKMATGMTSRTIALALKDRGPLLLGGRLGQAYAFALDTGEMSSFTYHMKALPQWAAAFNAEKRVDKIFGAQWQRALPESAYAISGADDSEFEGDYLGLGKKFPHRVDGGVAKPGPKFYEAFTTSPFGIDYTFEFARAAVVGEQLGGRGVTDVLAISISPTDYIGHAFGLYSHEYEDSLVRTDVALGAFFDWLDGKLGKDSYLVVLTADHGAAMSPEQGHAFGLDATRVKKAAMKAAVTSALDARYGKGDWVLALEEPSIYLNRNLIAERKLDAGEVERVAGEGLVTVPGFSDYATRTNIERNWMPATAASQAIVRSFHRVRSGDVIAVASPFSFWGKFGERDFGGSHGSYYRYDTDVPMLFAGTPFKPGYYGGAEMVNLAATLAHVLGIPPPALCEGSVLTAILR